MQARRVGITEGVVGEVCGVEVAISMSCLHWARWAAAMTSCIPCTHVDTRKQSCAQETSCKTLGLWVYRGLAGMSHGPAPELSKLLNFGDEDKEKTLSSPLSTLLPSFSPPRVPVRSPQPHWAEGGGAISIYGTPAVYSRSSSKHCYHPQFTDEETEVDYGRWHHE